MQRRFCVAPMLDWTDKHCRYFHRLLSTQAVLYTEMVTTGALIHGDRERYLRFNKFEHFVAEFFLLWFFFIGIWVLQPKISKKGVLKFAFFDILSII